MKIACTWGIAVVLAAMSARAAETRQSRTFRFNYAFSVNELQPHQLARVWLPMPPSDQTQTVDIVEKQLPAPPTCNRESTWGNQMLSFTACADDAGTIHGSITYRVMRRSVIDDSTRLDADRGSRTLYLQPNALVPVDGKPLTLLRGKVLPPEPMRLARLLYNVVDDHMQYRKDKPGWGRGDAVWACDSGFGNCTDFHSLFMSLARANHLPCRFEIGFSLPESRTRGDVAGYHCWAWFLPNGDKWVPVDISEANQHPSLRDFYFGRLDPDRVTFSTGRDLELAPRQQGPRLNFFIHPYVEVEGKPYPPEKIVRTCSFEDVSPNPGNAK